MELSDLGLDLKDLSQNEKKIADFILKNFFRISSMSTQEIASEIQVSTATISRFWKTIGFDNFKAFKNKLKASAYSNPANKMQNIIKKVENKDILAEMLDLAENNLKNTVQNLSRDALNKAIDTISKAKNVYIYAPGTTECLSSLLNFRLSRFHINVKPMAKSGHELLEFLMNVRQEDAVLLFGFVNALPEHKVILMNAGKVGYTTILFTDLYVSELIEMSDIVLYAERGELWEFHSLLSPMLLVEALVVGIALKNEEESLAMLDRLHDLRKEFKTYLPR